MVSLLEIDCTVHAVALARLRGDFANKDELAIKDKLAIKADPVAQPEAVRKVLNDPELLRRIMGFLDNGDAKDLVTSLQVSKPFFDSAATALCRRIEVPLYEYSSTKERDQYPVDMYCVSCHNEELEAYSQEAGITAHRSLHPGLSGAYLEQIQHTYRDRFSATAMMREMYKHVRVITVGKHDSCDRLAVSHPLPLAKTVIARGGHNKVCLPSRSQMGLMCGFLPRHPFRLILDYLCAGLVCQQCTSPNLLSEHVQTLVLRFDHETPRKHCQTRDLPRHFKPRRLVLLFKQETIEKEYGRRDADSNGCHMVAYGPGEGRDELTNTFYRMAKMALAGGNDCEVYIVAAEHAALHVRGLERYDSSLEGFHPLYPHARKYREEIPLWKRITLPAGARWVLDEEEPEVSRWISADGELHHMDEALDFYDSYYGHDGYDSEEEDDRETEAGERLTPSQYVCYDQKGWIVSATRPHRVAREHIPWARALINKRVAVMETLVHRWIDHILDSRLPSTQSQRFQKIKNDIDAVKRIKHASIYFISTYQYHRLEGNADEMDDPSKYF
jgi:hypothetical protein